MGKIQELYDDRVRPMTPAERLQLARLILDELAPAANAGQDSVDVSDEWSDDDISDLAAHAVRLADGPSVASAAVDVSGRP